MVIKDGEKWACAACIRGHRVSSCQHSERELHHINKKGRPVSQCHHCRGLRKSRAAHVKCDCGEHHHHHDGNGVTTDSKDDHCPCTTGSRCTCALKKEHVEHEETFKVHKPSHHPYHPHHKPSIPTRRSETTVPKARDGVSPINGNNSASQGLGAPFNLLKFHDDTALSDFSRAQGFNPAFDLQSPSCQAQLDYAPFIPVSPHDTRLTRSAHASPVLGPVQCVDTTDELLSKDFATDFQNPPQFSYLGNGFQFTNNRHSIHDFSAFNLDLDFAALSGQQNLSLNGPIGDDWPRLSLSQSMLDDGSFSLNPQVSSPSIDLSVSASARPGLSHSSSGTASELGDPTLADYSTSANTLRASPLDSAWDFGGPNNDSYGLSTSFSNNMPPSASFGLDSNDLSHNLGLTPSLSESIASPSSSKNPEVFGTTAPQDPVVLERFTQEVVTPADLPQDFPGLAMPNLDDPDDDPAGWPSESPYSVYTESGAAYPDQKPTWI